MYTLNATLYIMSSLDEVRQRGEFSAVKFLYWSLRKNRRPETGCDFPEIQRAVFGVRVMD